MRKIIIDGKELKDVNEFHRQFKEKLNFPDYYGNNLDALWDCVTASICLPVTIIWINYKFSEKILGPYAEIALEILYNAADLFPGELVIKIEF